MARIRWKRPTAKVGFDLQEQMQKALEWILESNKRQREEYKGWRDIGFYFSASDLERRVRSAADEISMGVPYGTYENHGGYGTRIMGLGGMTLLSHCRGYLAHQVVAGVLRHDQPSGKRVCSGLRFRPAEDDLTEAEKKSAEKRKENRVIRHYDENFESKRDNSRDINFALCQKDRTKKSYSWRAPRRMIRLTNKPEDVTCKLCLKMMAKMQHPATLNCPTSPPLPLTSELWLLADWLEEHGNNSELASHYRKLWQEKEKKDEGQV